MSFLVDTFGTNKVDADKINAAVNEVFDLRPKAEELDLPRPIYSPMATLEELMELVLLGRT